jgi:hypothetical protein
MMSGLSLSGLSQLRSAPSGAVVSKLRESECYNSRHAVEPVRSAVAGEVILHFRGLGRLRDSLLAMKRKGGYGSMSVL